MLDWTYRVQIPHRPGQLAIVFGAIAETEGLIGDVVTISIGRESSIREITVEVRHNAQAQEITAALDRLSGMPGSSCARRRWGSSGSERRGSGSRR